MGQSTFKLLQAIGHTAPGAAGAGNQNSALIGKAVIGPAITTAEPVKECLEALCHFPPVHRADPDDAVCFDQRMINIREIILNDAGSVFCAYAPAVPAGSAVLQLSAVQMDFFDLNAGVFQSENKFVFG